MTEITVALIIRTESLSLSELTAAVGATPSRGHSKGDVRFGGRQKLFQAPLRHTSWILRTDEEATAPLQDHLRELAAEVPPERLQEARHRLPDDVTVEIDVGVFYDGQAGHIEVAPESLDIVKAYGATLLVTSYYCEEESRGEQSSTTDKDNA